MPLVFRNKLFFTAGAGWDEPFTAGEDLSAKQFSFVIPGSVVGEVKLATGASDPVPIGVLQNSPTTGATARVRVFGITQVSGCPAACDLGYGRFITSSSTGKAQASASTTGGIALGRWLSACTVTGGSLLGNAFVDCIVTATCIVSTS